VTFSLYFAEILTPVEPSKHLLQQKQAQTSGVPLSRLTVSTFMKEDSSNKKGSLQ
jgi:hypothetical protein